MIRVIVAEFSELGNSNACLPLKTPSWKSWVTINAWMGGCKTELREFGDYRWLFGDAKPNSESSATMRRLRPIF